MGDDEMRRDAERIREEIRRGAEPFRRALERSGS